MPRPSGRRFEPTLAPIVRREGHRVALAAPSPGYLRHPPSPGEVLVEGQRLAELEVLGIVHRLDVPAGVGGVVVEVGGPAGFARRPTEHGAVIAVLDTEAGRIAEEHRSDVGERAQAMGLVWRTPLGGRYYGRPAPGAEPFVREGSIVEEGHTVALIEVMKTFNRASYGGPGLPPRARVARVLVNDGDDVATGDAILALEPLDAG